MAIILIMGLLWWLGGKESACQCRRRKFDPWVRKIPWRRKWQPNPVFLPGKCHGWEPGGLQSMGWQKVGPDWTTKQQQWACVLSCFSRVWLPVILWTVVHQAPLSIEFSRQEYWSRWPFPPPADLPNPGMELESLMSPELAGGFLTTRTTWEAQNNNNNNKNKP